MDSEGEVGQDEVGQDEVGLRVLVVEDEWLIAELIATVLTDMGCVVIGPVAGLAPALALARTGDVQAAILDVTIQGGAVFPVAEALLARDIPFVLATGYGRWSLPDNMRSQNCLSKPYILPQLEAQIRVLALQVKDGRKKQDLLF
jgi:DNA-binding response OmpR family regulator